MSDIVTVARTLLAHVNAPDGWVFMGHEGSFPLEIRDAKTFNEVVTLKDDINDMGETIAQMPSVIAQLVDALESQRAAVWLEWRPSAGKDYALVYRHEGLTFPMYRVFASSLPDDYGAESLTGGTSAYGSLDFVLAEIAAHCASRIPSLRLPPFPEITDV